jgi:hypothetical protein
MQGFSLEGTADEIFFDKTKKYFKEVLSSYQNENYRSAVVMLWSVAVCDIVYKLQHLIDLYADGVATEIIDEMTQLQATDPTSSAWEIKLVDDTFRKTKLLDGPEYENLRFLQKQRHLSAHPVLTQERELHAPNKDTVRSLLRNTLEGLLVKPPFYTQRILEEMLSDLAEHREALNDRHKVRQFVESRYLRRFKPEVETSIYRSFWKLTFRLRNAECDANRRINLNVIEAISERNAGRLNEIIRAEQEYYSNVAAEGEPLMLLVYYLSIRPELYTLLTDAAKLSIRHCIEVDPFGKISGWFVKDNVQQHYQDLVEWITGTEDPTLEDDHWYLAFRVQDSAEWQQNACKLIGAYYGASGNFNDADARFSQAVKSRLHLFDAEAMRFMLELIEENNQTYGRGRASSEHAEVRARALAIDPNFDFTAYDRFYRSCAPLPEA